MIHLLVVFVPLGNEVEPRIEHSRLLGGNLETRWSNMSRKALKGIVISQKFWATRYIKQQYGVSELSTG